MKIAIIGATGFLGTSLTQEFTNRKHEVTAISRSEKDSDIENLKYVAVDVNDIEALASVLKGQDAVVSAYNPGWTNPNIYADFLVGAKAIQEAVKLSSVKRLITVGGAGSLFIDGKQLVDGPDFPADIKPGAVAAREYLDIIKEEKELDWAFFSPAIEMHPGITTGRTGKYRLGTESPVFNEEGRSILSGEDVAVVLADEVENPKHHQVRFTAAY
ncbi:NAD(P)-dependent oxidoreductase [Flavobacterium macacae]|uniref:NAD-dependent epimerase/dehydratase family protein n=1 Tax=Flavobacterium macacae TaxID=2488993 RepID=A0A3P3WAB8_9FLAO|nr:NAD(P)H-binding protein [Flavobacterium macacae]RRJ92112.1 NAD-dependent epimerase/dehydratase family protein [Flavobacterium macacae]